MIPKPVDRAERLAGGSDRFGAAGGTDSSSGPDAGSGTTDVFASDAFSRPGRGGGLACDLAGG